jgi:hypothetical protein
MSTMRGRCVVLTGLCGLALLAVACGDAGDGTATGTPIGAPGGDGKADSATAPYADGTKGACTLLAAANDASPAELSVSGIPSTAARAIVAYRAGADGQLNTADDQIILTVAALDAIPGVGPVTLQKLYEWGTTSTYTCNKTTPPPGKPPATQPPRSPKPGTTPSGVLPAQENINWVNTTRSPQDGDIRVLRLFSDGDFVRLRCYGGSCAQSIPETQKVTLYSASSGKKYLDFMSFTKSGDPNVDDPSAVRDSYEVQVESATTIKLRKTRTSTWRTFHPATDQALCTATGGAWVPKGNGDPFQDCGCGDGNAGYGGHGYVAGAGCIHFAAASEDGCDSTGGHYTDDDATKIGAYCDCPVGQYISDDGCADVPQ